MKKKKIYNTLGKMFYVLLTIFVFLLVGWLDAGRTTAWITGTLTPEIFYLPVSILGGILLLLIIIRFVLKKQITSEADKK